MASRQPQRSLGALFLLLAIFFAGGAFTAGAAGSGGAGHWIIAVAAAVISFWFVGLCIRAFRTG